MLVSHLLNEYECLCDLHALQRQNAGGALGILKMFGLEDVVERLMTIIPGDTASASGVHDLLNILSLITDLHIAFDALKLAFEPTADNEVW